MTSNTSSTSLREIYLRAVDVTDLPAREAYLSDACGSSTPLRAQVEQLLAAASPEAGNPLQRAAQLLSGGTEEPAIEATSISNVADNDAPTATNHNALRGQIDISTHPRIGAYKLLEEIGRGGMGVVYMAQQMQPVKRKVALKVIKPGMDTREVIARFEAERQALAMMDHPHIAKVLDAGTTHAGRPYFVMELVRGVRLTDFCQEKKLGLRERLELFVHVCKAVQHAHQKGIIHRDLKPGNLLVTLHDGVPVVKIIDFGVAKALTQELTERTLFTQFSQMIGTPLYMAPEQAEMSGLDIDTRSDIYSLGVILYELLTGTTPFDRETMSKLGVDGIRKLLKEQDPQRPSVRMSTLRAARQSTVDDLRVLDVQNVTRQLQRELDWIVMKALEKDRERRYESANALAADVRRYMDDEPVEACPPSVAYRLTKYAKRNKAVLTTASILLAMLITSSVVSTVFAVRATNVQTASARSAADAYAAQKIAEEEKANAVAAQAEAVTAQKMSETNLAAALNAVDKLLQHASTPELMEVPRVQPLLKKIVMDTLEFYDEFEVSKADSPDIRLHAARTRVRLAQLAALLADSELNKSAYLAALAEFDKLIQEFPEDDSYRRQHAATLRRLGWLHIHQIHDFDTAQFYFEESLRNFEVMADAHPGHNDDSDIVLALEGLAAANKHQGHLESHREIITLGFTEHGFHAKEFAKLLEGEDPERAEDVWLQHLGDCRQQLQSVGTRDFTMNYVAELNEAARFMKTRDPQKASDLITEAYELALQQVTEFPEVHPTKYIFHRVLATKFECVLSQEPGPERHRQVVELLTHDPEFTSALHRKYADLLKDSDDAISLLTDMIEQFPEVFDYYLARSAAYTAAGQLEALQSDLVKATRLLTTLPSEPNQSIEIKPYNRWCQLALRSLAVGDQATYQTVCGRMLEAPFASIQNKNGNETHFTAWTCALAAKALDDYEPAIKLARHAVETAPDNQQYLNGLGAILLRAGKYEEAEEQLQQALAETARDTTSPGYTQYFLAMTQHHLGDAAAAHEHLRKANEAADKELQSDPVWNRKLTLELLRKEAEALLNPEAAATSAAQDTPP